MNLSMKIIEARSVARAQLGIYDIPRGFESFALLSFFPPTIGTGVLTPLPLVVVTISLPAS